LELIKRVRSAFTESISLTTVSSPVIFAPIAAAEIPSGSVALIFSRAFLISPAS
jgi:hypothetical protein